MTRSDVFRAGDVLNGYRLLEDFRVVGAGLSEWSFAERGGREFFIKRFLSPTYPEADAPGSERIKAAPAGARPSGHLPRVLPSAGRPRGDLCGPVRFRRGPRRHREAAAGAPL